MPGPRSCAVTLAQEVREKLQAICRAAKSPQREVLRARIVLLAAQGASNARIARQLSVTSGTVRKWRRRFVGQGLAGLLDRQRSGRPCRFDAITRSELISLACRPVPAELCRNHWTHGELRSALLGAGLIDAISLASVARLLTEVDLRPQRFKMWIHSPDPQFRPKVTEICALYTNPAGWDEVVVCVDEKTGMQALRRRFPGRAPSPLEIGRWEFEYKRCGTRCLTAAFDVHTGKVFGMVTRRRTKQDLLEFLEARSRAIHCRLEVRMANPEAQANAEALQQQLRMHDDWKHLAVKARGRTLVIGAEDGPGDPLVRLELVRPELYALSIMWHDNRWQRLPVMASLKEIVALLRAEYASLLTAA